MQIHQIFITTLLLLVGQTTSLLKEMNPSTLQNTNGKLLLMYYAPWCPYCKAMTPKLQEVAAEYSNRVMIGRLNCIKYTNLCDKIMYYPTLTWYNNGINSSSEDIEAYTHDDIVNYIESKLSSLT
ncbi:hypothetical protein GJ496_011723 [Pomphorhynchus laevis]|nr:hypothetical protein GJ496_011723 [Pomphorhynchus laevis]